jgi:hypothetical protein
MIRRSLVPTALIAMSVATAAFTRPAPTLAKWPPWLSIESPVNPYDASARGALLLVHAAFREGPSQVSDLSGTAEGIVDGARRSVPLRFEATDRPNVYALRRQWPAEGRWVLRIALRSTTAVVTLDPAGNVASAQVPMTVTTTGDRVPRAVTTREVDSVLTALARR